MKKVLFIMVLFCVLTLQAQQNQNPAEVFKSRPEIYFSLQIDDTKQLHGLNKMMYVDRFEDGIVYAYANQRQYEKIREAGLNIQLLTTPSMTGEYPLMKGPDEMKGVNDWDFYPTYEAYVSQMNAFAANYPDLCSLHTIANLSSGRQLLAIHINPNPDAGGKPEFLYTSSIHGDELTGYIISLRLIDYLLSNYGSDPMVTNLVENIDIWINPLANPDGTYAGGNSTVWGATRGNHNGIDMNRNYPDPQDGPHPDGEQYQTETTAFMDFATQRNFVMSANFHGGAEVANYPWDTWVRRHADDEWWNYVSRGFADTIHAHAVAGYFTDLDNGVTNGYDWYEVDGGRQDYMNYFQQCREETMEISAIKTIAPASLPAHWNYNYRSWLNFMEQTLFGFRGIVTDSVTGLPIVAKVQVVDHDLDNSFVYSALPAGNYHRPIKAGTYDLVFSADGYYPKTITGLVAVDRQSTTRNVALVPGSIIANFETTNTGPAKGQKIDFTDMSFGINIVQWQWTFEGAEPSTSTEQNPSGILYPTVGNFDVTLTITNNVGEHSTTVKPNYITVSQYYLMQNAEFTTCSGTFMDSGGDLGDYADNEDFQAVFFPEESGKSIRLNFTAFNVESNPSCAYDWMKIYDGTSTSASLIGTWCGTNSPNEITATNDDGALTVVFHSDESERRPGWRATVSCTTGVGLLEKTAENVVIGPNPVDRQSVLHITAEVDPLSIAIFNNAGQLVYIDEKPEKRDFTLPVSILQRGSYVIRVSLPGSTVVRKLIVL
ncbi:MAG: T9SS type A sorting domain-containing protein [Bacteroidales bacterium]|nr:T9SS type A sorting domain-containing protein [Bacteroidales bacterium]